MEHVNNPGAGRRLIGGARVKQSVPQKPESGLAEVPLPMREGNQQLLTLTPNSYRLRCFNPLGLEKLLNWRSHRPRKLQRGFPEVVLNIA